MGMSRRQRDKGARKAQELIPDGRVTGYVIGRTGPHPVLVVGGILLLFVAASVAVAVATGQVVVPGVLVVLLLQHLVSPPRGLAVCDRGVALTDRSVLHGRPTKIVALTAFEGVQPRQVRLGRAEVVVGQESVWLTSGEEERLRTAIGAARTPPAWTGPTGPHATAPTA